MWRFAEGAVSRRAEREGRRLSGIATSLPVVLLAACTARPAGVHSVRDDGESAPIGGLNIGRATPGAAQGTSTDAWRDVFDRLDAGSDRSDGQRSELGDAIESAPAWGSDESRSWLIPAAEVVAFQFLLNQYDRHYVSDEDYGTDLGSIRDNLGRGTAIDQDPFRINQFGHPYAGSIYHGFARSAGLTYWAALGYDFVGSALWEVAGETTPPSRNDHITTTFAGSFLGEALFRTANYVLSDGGGRPGLGREVLAALTSPPTGVNRLAFGDRFDGPYPSHDPAVNYMLGVGARRNASISDIEKLSSVSRDRAMATFGIDYGLPGKPGYEYVRPFDYFHLEATATSSGNALPENIMVRGLLVGTDYESGPDYRGIWGLYGTYDYFAPEVFKVSSTGVGIGTTGQYLLSDEFALQGTAEGGVGFTAVGSTADHPVDRDFRYGFSPQGLLALRSAWSDVAMLDLTVNDYLVSAGASSSDTSGGENIVRAQLGLTVRVYERHAIGVQLALTRRDPRFSGLGNLHQAVGALSLFYTFLGDREFGVVRKERRPTDD